MKALQTRRIEDLSLAAVSERSRPFEFRTGHGITWEIVLAPGCICPNCDNTFIHNDAGNICPICATHDKESYLEERAPEPMVDFIWPLPYFTDNLSAAQAAQGRLLNANTAVCLVHLIGDNVDDDDAYALALTSNGADLSWNLAYAYVLLGYIPPFSLCTLPNVGHDVHKEPYWTVIKSCIASIEAVEYNLNWTKRRVADTLRLGRTCAVCGHDAKHDPAKGCSFFSGSFCPCTNRYWEECPPDAGIVWEMTETWNE